MANPLPIGLPLLEKRTGFLSGLYRDLLESGIRYFFPGATLERVSEGAEQMPTFLGAVPNRGQVEFEWMGAGYTLTAGSSCPITNAACCAVLAWCCRHAIN